MDEIYVVVEDKDQQKFTDRLHTARGELIKRGAESTTIVAYSVVAIEHPKNSNYSEILRSAILKGVK
jgi:hypothetical protein